MAAEKQWLKMEQAATTGTDTCTDDPFDLDRVLLMCYCHNSSVSVSGIPLESCTQPSIVSGDYSTSLLLLRSGFLQQDCILHATI